MGTIEISFNGELKRVGSSTVDELLDAFELCGKKVAVELNREIVARTAYTRTKINPGDRIEVVHFVGGG